MFKYRKYLYPIIWFAFLIYASLSPSDKIPNVNLFENADKLIHFVFYFVFTVLLIPVFLEKQQYNKSYLISAIFTVLMGIIFEVLQEYLTTGRHGSIYDIIANTLGTISGIIFFKLLIRGNQIEKIFF